MPEEIESRPADLRLQKKSLLKAGLRAFFVEDRDLIGQVPWFRAFLAGEEVRFYVQGSGVYHLANMGCVSQEVYLVRAPLPPVAPPSIFLCDQTDYLASSQTLGTLLTQAIVQVKQVDSVNLRLQTLPRPAAGGIRLDTELRRRIRQAPVVIADVTPVAVLGGQGLPSSSVCLAAGYALMAKAPHQVRLVNLGRPEASFQNLEHPFSLSKELYLNAAHPQQFATTLVTYLEEVLRRYRLA
ncbi:MAG: hypothetical protein IGQ88_12935 [Gloeomargaritaceae cyanobacterium C42_A2020_066]|nr:hypothetical protein [Gloeomargaritaceae cyanobacterium C42_A2020_066]